MENTYLYTNVLSKGIDVKENNFFKDVLDEKSFILKLDGTKNLDISFCSCGNTFENNRNKCPKCGNSENVYYISTESCPTFRKINFTETENGFKLKIIEFEAFFDFVNIYIENLNNEAEFEFTYENSSYHYNSHRPFRSFDNFDCDVNDEYNQLLKFIHGKYPDIYEILKDLGGLGELEDFLQTLYIMFNYKAFRNRDIMKSGIAKYLLKNSLREYSFNEKKFKKELKSFNLNATTIEEFLNINKIFRGFLFKDSNYDIDCLMEFSRELSEDNITYIPIFIEQNLLDINAISSFMRHYKKSNVEFNTFLKFIFSCSYNENLKVSYVLNSYYDCLNLSDNISFDYKKPYKTIYYYKYKSREILKLKNIVNYEDFDFLCESPSLNNFIKLANKKLL